MSNIQNKLYVITGGPGVGKTNLLNELNKCGIQTVSEDARKIIKNQIKIKGNGLPWKDKQYYAELMFNASVKSYKNIIHSENQNEIVVFDRGIIDTLCYMNMENIPISERMEKIVHEHKYNKRVFILPPWKEIYETDNERKQTWEEALFTFDKMKETYLKYDYEMIEVLKDSIENRKNFILDIIKNKSSF